MGIDSGWKMILQIFWAFFKIGPVTFGGGYAIIPMIEREVVENRRWIKEEEIEDVISLSQTIPGAVGINSAAFIGYRLAGVKGAVAATLGILLPTFLIVLGLSAISLSIRHHPKVEAAFEGISAAVVAMIVYAGIRMAKTAVFDKTTFAMAGLTILLFFLHVSPVVMVVAGALAGILLIEFREKLGRITQFEKQHKKGSISR